MSGSRVVVVGAGVGGLVAAALLAGAGRDVLVVERASQAGGKLRHEHVGGRAIDAGPTVFTMRWVFDELFDQLGASFERDVRLLPLHVLARHAWSAGERLDLFSDLPASLDAIAAFAGPAEARRYGDFCVRAERIYRTLERPFLRDQRPTPWTLPLRVGLAGLPDLARISPFTTLWNALGRHFHDPRLRQLFGRYATYCGSSPYRAPATLMLVAHVERAGVWAIEGGMQRLAEALAALASRQGARLRFDAHVDELLVRDGKVRGVRLAGGERLDADAVVFNGDSAALVQGRLGAAASRAVHARLPARGRSQSALTWCLVAPTQGFPLLRHNVFFGRRYTDEFDAVFEHARLPDEPTVYVCAQDRDDRATPPDGAAERLFCLVNAPAAGQRGLDAMEVKQCEQTAFRMLSRCGLQVQRESASMLTTTPADFARRFPGTGGALYGQASHGWLASFQRPGSRSRLPGLYLAGGSTHPGPGVPMAALSGRLAAQSLLADRVSTHRWQPAAMPGGMPTR